MTDYVINPSGYYFKLLLKRFLNSEEISQLGSVPSSLSVKRESCPGFFFFFCSEWRFNNSISNYSISHQFKKAIYKKHYYTAATAAKSLQSCPTLRPHRRQPTRLPRPWDSPGKNTGVGCHFLLQCIRVKSESEVAQSCPTLSDPMDCSPPGSSIHGIFQARVLEWGAIAFSDYYTTTTFKFIKHF